MLIVHDQKALLLTSIFVDIIEIASIMSTMIDETDDLDVVPKENIRTLIYYLGLAMDARIEDFRRGTPYENVRPSDVRLFVTAARNIQTISETARELGITRQAAQTGVQRLLKLGVVILSPVPNNKRDKFVIISPRGMLASKTAKQQIERLEAEFASIIGNEGLSVLRANLRSLLKATQTLTDAENAKT